MRIPWKLKSRIFGLIDRFQAPSVLYFLQKNVTKRSRITELKIDKNWVAHEKALQAHNACGFVFEFGAGKSLAQNLYLSRIIDTQLLVDLNPMIDLMLVERARSLLSAEFPLRSNKNIATLEDLAAYGIEYRAPFDAASLEVGERLLDACISTNTLEHIPKESIARIFKNLHKVLKYDGIVSAKIDYSDHYAHTDPSISLLNYLRFDEAEWQQYNHDCHYQNRLRHYDYVQIFEACGFQVIDEEIDFAAGNIPAEIAKAHQDCDPRWQATAAHITLKKAGH